ncbi:triose-phosphate isomerase [Azonexus sp.]|uniref:triose-phosphate isomerase n=1 Tax=Azonexus sp. TaxID=1872668 RepID=UPI0039E60723
MRRKLVAGNWKMHGSLAANAALLTALLAEADTFSCEVAVCPPFVYLPQAQQLLQGSVLQLGAQNGSQHAAGAYTGEVAVAMLQEFGCRYVLLGHSERRAIFGESDASVAAKFEAVLAGGLVPVLCVGETLADRQAGETQAVVGRQLDAVLARLGAAALGQGVVAYEPVWAIGTGQTATPEEAQAVHRFIRQRVAASDAAVAANLRILYGGSVKAQNAGALFAQADIDGGLIGGAALVAEDFLAICRAADRASSLQ